MNGLDHRFPVSVRLTGDRLTRVSVPGKHALDVATPPEFRGVHPDVWSPEDLFVAAAASCYAVTLAASAERSALPLHGLSVEGTGTVARRDDGRFAFTALRLDVALEAEPGLEEKAERLARKAEDACLVTLSLAVPVELRVAVRTRLAAA